VSNQMWIDVDNYFAERLGLDDDALRGANDAATAGGLPPIQVSAPAGRLLELLVATAGAKSALEVGTLGGYSTISLARGVGPDGCVVSLEIDPHHAEVARASLDAAGVGERVAIRVGPALETLDQMVAQGGTSIDFAFIDADKANNPNYFSRALEMSHPGTLIVVDNVVRDGRVLDASSTDADIQGTRALFDLVHESERVQATALQTVGTKDYDGFLLARVIS
jgi:predicted O-methyltransferase YrrM